VRGRNSVGKRSCGGGIGSWETPNVCPSLTCENAIFCSAENWLFGNTYRLQRCGSAVGKHLREGGRCEKTQGGREAIAHRGGEVIYVSLLVTRETPKKTIMRIFLLAFLSLHALLALFCLFKLVREQIPNQFLKENKMGGVGFLFF
jgi:hypothetical protein